MWFCTTVKNRIKIICKCKCFNKNIIIEVKSEDDVEDAIKKIRDLFQ